MMHVQSCCFAHKTNCLLKLSLWSSSWLLKFSIFLYSLIWIPLKAGHLVPDQRFLCRAPFSPTMHSKPGAKKNENHQQKTKRLDFTLRKLQNINTAKTLPATWMELFSPEQGSILRLPVFGQRGFYIRFKEVLTSLLFCVKFVVGKHQ